MMAAHNIRTRAKQLEALNPCKLQALQVNGHFFTVTQHSTQQGTATPPARASVPLTSPSSTLPTRAKTISTAQADEILASWDQSQSAEASRVSLFGTRDKLSSFATLSGYPYIIGERDLV